MKVPESANRILLTGSAEPVTSISRLLIQKYIHQYPALVDETLFTRNVLHLEQRINRLRPTIVLIGEGVDGFKNTASCASYLAPRYPLARLIGFGGGLSEDDAKEYRKHLLGFIVLSDSGNVVVDLLAHPQLEDTTSLLMKMTAASYCIVFDSPMHASL